MSSAPRISVLHIAPTPFFSDRGCHLRIRGIVHGLEEQGIRSVVCTYPIGHDVEGVSVVRCPRIPGYRKTDSGPSPFKYVADILMIFTSARQIRRMNPDALHCHLHEGVLIGWLGRLLAFRIRTPIVFDMQGSLTGELVAHGYIRKRTIPHRIFAAIERVIVSLAQVFVCSSDASGQILADRYNVPMDRIHIVPDGTDIAGNRDIRDSEADAERRRTVALYSGGLSESKGLGSLMRIIEEAERRKSNLRFLIVGYPTDDFEDFLRQKGLAHRCEIAGRVAYAELPQYFSRAGMALEPKPAGAGEASGKLVNYMAGGLPVICFDTGNNRRILEDMGYFVSPGDIKAFVDRMEECVANPSRAAKFAQAGVLRAERHYSWSLAGEKVMDAYRSVNVRPAVKPDSDSNKEWV